MRQLLAGWNWNQLEQKPEWWVCKHLKTWWPGTESNRRRQPFQGCLPTLLSGSESAQVGNYKQLRAEAV